MTQANTDSDMLKRRISAHDKYAKKDINEWIFEAIDIKDAEDVLDIGCGTGKQLIPIADMTSGKVVGFDVSQESLNYIHKTLGEKENVRLVGAEMENLKEALRGQGPFDLILSCFAIYYPKDTARVFDDLKSLLKEDGRLFICGPAESNNQALFDLHTKVAPMPKVYRGFFENKALPLLKERFKTVETFRFTNPIEFPSAEAITEYWASAKMGVPEKKEQFLEAAKEACQGGKFITTKEVTGILARDPR